MLYCDLSYFHWTFMFYSLFWLFEYFNYSKYFQGFSYSWLFNFQDAFCFFVIRSCRTTSLLYHIFSRLSSLFQNFFEIFFGSSFLAFVRHFLSYHIFFILSSTFQNFFEEFFLLSFRFRAVLFSISHFVAFVKPFCDIFYCPLFCPFCKILYSRLRSSFRLLPGFFEVFPSLTA